MIFHEGVTTNPRHCRVISFRRDVPFNDAYERTDRFAYDVSLLGVRKNSGGVFSTRAITVPRARARASKVVQSLNAIAEPVRIDQYAAAEAPY